MTALKTGLPVLFIIVAIMALFNPFVLKNISCHFENADLLITDPCYFIRDDEGEIWENYCEDLSNNQSLDKFGLTTGLCYALGDYYRDQIVDESGSAIAIFCSDSGIVSCVRLDEVLAHNPDFAKELEDCPGAYAIIRDFTGNVQFQVKKERYSGLRMIPVVKIIGRGTTNFHSEYSDKE